MRSLSGETRGEKRNGVQVGELGWALAVVIHLPHFLVSAAGRDVVDVGLGDAGDAAPQASNDLVGKAMSDQACIVLAGSLVVLLAQDLRRARVLGVEEPAVNRQAIAIHRERAKGHKRGIGRALRPRAPGSSVAESAGVSGGAMLFETMSKMPALLRSLKSVLSKVVFSAGVCASAEAGLKSAAARRMRAAPRLVPVRTQSCALALQHPRGSDRRTRNKTASGRMEYSFSGSHAVSSLEFI